MIQMDEKQFEILDHAIKRATRGVYCGNPPGMAELVEAGLMKSRGKVEWCPDEYFAVTVEGRAQHAAELIRREFLDIE